MAGRLCIGRTLDRLRAAVMNLRRERRCTDVVGGVQPHTITDQNMLDVRAVNSLFSRVLRGGCRVAVPAQRLACGPRLGDSLSES